MQQAAAVVSRNSFGSSVRRYDFDGISVEDVIMPAGLSVPLHAHDGAQIYFVLEGRYSEAVCSRRYFLGPGQGWFRSPRELHENSVVGAEPALTLIATFSERRLASAARRRTMPLSAAALADVRSEIVREMAAGDASSRTALEGWALLLLSRAERLLLADHDAVPEWYGRAVAYLYDHYRQPISLESVAAHTGVHPATLAAAFRRLRGTSVGDCIRELRLQYARDELLRTRRPLKEIAMDAGFYDQAHFGRWFRRRFGTSPAALRHAL